MAAVTVLSFATANASGKGEVVFLYGFATTLVDSTVYITEIQRLDSAELAPKNKFLVGRADYSNQLASYLASQGVAPTTCITSFGVNQHEVEKRYVKLRQRYLKDHRWNIQYVKTSDFNYQAVRSNNVQ